MRILRKPWLDGVRPIGFKKYVRFFLLGLRIDVTYFKKKYANYPQY